MSTKHEQTRWTDSRARREVEAWKRSGESMAAYARKHGYPAHRLSWWQKRLARDAEAAKAPETVPVDPLVANFLRVEPPAWYQRGTFCAVQAPCEGQTWISPGVKSASFTRDGELGHLCPAGVSSRRFWSRGVCNVEVEFAPAVITGARRSPVVVTVDGDGVRLEVGDPGAVHPVWLAELVTALRSGASA